jgi:hypothetical protein
MGDRSPASRAGRWRGLLGGLVLTALLAGCNLVELGYHQLDWVMRQRVERFVFLEEEQRRRLEQDIDALLAWHCRTQLPKYVDVLDDLRRDFGAGAVTPARVRAYSDRLEGYWYALLERGSIGAGNLLASLSDRQLQELDATLAERNRDSAREVRADAGRDPSRDYARLAERQWRRWLGPLNAEQERLIGDWSRAFEPLGSLGVDYRSQLRHDLRELVTAHRGDPAAMRAALLRFIDAIRDAPPARYAARVDANKRLSIDMVAAVAVAADREQVAHLLRVAGGWRRDLAGVACR